MNILQKSTRKKALSLALFLVAPPTVLRAMQIENANDATRQALASVQTTYSLGGALVGPGGIPLNLEQAEALVREQQNLALATGPAMWQRAASRRRSPGSNFSERITAQVHDARQGTRNRWADMNPRTRTIAKIVAGAGIISAAGFLGHKLYEWWKKPVIRVIIEKE